MGRIEVWVEDASGTVLGDGPLANASDVTVTRVLNGPGEIAVTVPASDPRVQDVIANERRLTLYREVVTQGAYTYLTDGSGTYLTTPSGARLTAGDVESTHTMHQAGQGIARVISGAASGDGPRLTISGPDILREVAHVNCLRGRTYSRYWLHWTIANLMTLVSGWSLDQDTLTERRRLSARFDGASVLRALQELAARYDQRFRLAASGKTIEYGDLGDEAPIRIIQAGRDVPPALAGNEAVAVIDNLTWDDNSEDVVNWIEPIGSDDSGPMTLEHSTRGADSEGFATGLDATPTVRGGLQGGSAYTWGQEIAMSFQLETAAWITKAQLSMRKDGSPAGTMTLRVETDSSGPSGTLVDANATASLAESGLSGTYTDETFTFAGGFYLAAGTTYWLRLSTTRSFDNSNYVMWGRVGSDQYTDGVFATYNGTIWTGQTGDAVFEVISSIDSRTTDVIAEHASSNRDGVIALQQDGYIAGDQIDYTGSSHDASHNSADADLAFDGSGQFKWPGTGANGDPAWVEIQLASAAPCWKYRIYAESGNYPIAWELQGSNDGINFDTLDSRSGQSWTGGVAIQTYYATSSTSYSYYRLYITEYDSTHPVIREIFLYEAVAGNLSEIAQSFDAGSADVAVDTVQLWLSKHGSPTGNLTVEIQTDSSGEPSGTVVAVGSAASDAVAASTLGTTLARVTFEFALAPRLTASTTYWLVLKTTGGADVDDFVQVAIDRDSGYGDGALVAYGDSQWLVQNADAVFVVRADCQVEPYVIQTMTGPDGSTVYYLSDADSISTYGQIEKVLQFDIAPLDGTSEAAVEAANALYDASANWLQRKKDKVTVYTCELRGVKDITLLPGQKIHLRYHGMVTARSGEAVIWRDIDDEFWIVEVSERLDDGTFTLTLSDIDRPPMSEADALVNTLERIELLIL